MRLHGRKSETRGAALIEFALVSSALLALIFATLEFDRMLLVYATLADSTRAGARYAIVHGATRTGTGSDGPSGPAINPAGVVAVVQSNARAGLVNAGALTASCSSGGPGICVTYPDGNNNPGSRVKITLICAYDPFTMWPVGVRLASTTQAVIAF
jgi:Flp pilus assembly protein TadG